MTCIDSGKGVWTPALGHEARPSPREESHEDFFQARQPQCVQKSPAQHLEPYPRIPLTILSISLLSSLPEDRRQQKWTSQDDWDD